MMTSILALTALSTTGKAQFGGVLNPGPPQGKVYPLFDYQLQNGGNLPQTFYYTMEEDIITMTVEDGTSAGVGPEEMRVVLTTIPGLTWRKEICSWNGMLGIATSCVSTQDNNHGPVAMTVPLGFGSINDTLLFRKAKFLGFMFDMYYLDPGNTKRILKGKIVTFNWRHDSDLVNEYPMPCESPCVPVGTTRRATDIVLTGANGWNTLPVASSIGDGTFKVTNMPAGDFGAWASDPQAVKLTGDFNGDGKTDIALTGPDSWNTLPVAFSKGRTGFWVTNKEVGSFASMASTPNTTKLTRDVN